MRNQTEGKNVYHMKRFNRNTTYNYSANILIHIRLTFGFSMSQDCKKVPSSALSVLQFWHVFFVALHIKICCHKVSTLSFWRWFQRTQHIRFTKPKKVHVWSFQFTKPSPWHFFLVRRLSGFHFMCKINKLMTALDCQCFVECKPEAAWGCSGNYIL